MTRGLHYDLCLKYLVYINFSEVDFLPDRLCVVFENVHRKLKCFGVYVVLLLKGKIKKKKASHKNILSRPDNAGPSVSRRSCSQSWHARL